MSWPAQRGSGPVAMDTRADEDQDSGSVFGIGLGGGDQFPSHSKFAHPRSGDEIPALSGADNGAIRTQYRPPPAAATAPSFPSLSNWLEKMRAEAAQSKGSGNGADARPPPESRGKERASAASLASIARRLDPNGSSGLRWLTPDPWSEAGTDERSYGNKKRSREVLDSGQHLPPAQPFSRSRTPAAIVRAAEQAAAAATASADAPSSKRRRLENDRKRPQIVVGNWTQSLANLREVHQETAAQLQASMVIRSRTSASCSRLRSTTVTEGELREQSVYKTLNSFGMIRTKQQRQFHDAGVLANIRHVHGRDYERNRIRIMRKKRIHEIRTEVLCQTPRRYGKTTSVAMLCAALMLNVPGIRIAIFSTGRRASQSLMHLIVTLIYKIKSGEQRIIAKNQEQLLIASAATAASALESKTSIKNKALDPTTSVLMSLPGSEAGAFL